jgi:hypothetical protein
MFVSELKSEVETLVVAGSVVGVVLVVVGVVFVVVGVVFVVEV